MDPVKQFEARVESRVRATRELTYRTPEGVIVRIAEKGALGTVARATNGRRFIGVRFDHRKDVVDAPLDSLEVVS